MRSNRGVHPDDTSRRFQIDLFILHPTIDPADISHQLGLKGNAVQRVDTHRRTPKGTQLEGNYPDTRWRYCCRYRTKGQWFEEQLTAFVELLLPHQAFLKHLRATGGTASIILKTLGDGFFGDAVSFSTLTKLVDLELDLGFESFVVPQSETGKHPMIDIE